MSRPQSAFSSRGQPRPLCPRCVQSSLVLGEVRRVLSSFSRKRKSGDRTAPESGWSAEETLLLLMDVCGIEKNLSDAVEDTQPGNPEHNECSKSEEGEQEKREKDIFFWWVFEKGEAPGKPLKKTTAPRSARRRPLPIIGSPSPSPLSRRGEGSRKNESQKMKLFSEDAVCVEEVERAPGGEKAAPYADVALEEKLGGPQLIESEYGGGANPSERLLPLDRVERDVEEETRNQKLKAGLFRRNNFGGPTGRLKSPFSDNFRSGGGYSFMHCKGSKLRESSPSASPKCPLSSKERRVPKGIPREHSADTARRDSGANDREFAPSGLKTLERSPQQNSQLRKSIFMIRPKTKGRSAIQG